MTVEELRIGLEEIVLGLTASGFDNIDIGAIEKLDKFAASAEQLGMKEGKRLIENLSGTMKAIQEGKSGAGSGEIRLMALDFYAKKLSADSGKLEDL